MSTETNNLLLSTLSAYTDFGGGMKALYVFAYARGTDSPATASFTPASLGLPGSVYVYDYFCQR